MKLLASAIHLFLLTFLVNRPYDFLVDADYMERWYVIPRNRFFNIYYHHFMGSDANTMHDHPWWSISFILRGGYTEHTPLKMYSTGTCTAADEANYKNKGSVTFRRALDAHWIEIDEPVHTLFITGPKVRSWGFICASGWVHWKEYVLKRGNDRHGNGCGEVDAELSQELKARLGIGE